MLQVTLEFNHHQTLMAESGREALAIARAEHPDVILLDIMMPGSDVDGLEACRLLKTDPVTANITIFLLSARGQKKDIQAGMEAGADDYFTKPFSPMALIKRVDEMVGQKESDSSIQNNV